MRGKAIQKTLIKTNQSNSTKPLPGRISICSVVLFFNASSCSVHSIIFTVKGGIYFLFWTSYLAQEAALQQKKDYEVLIHASLIDSLHLFASSITCMSQLSFRCYLCQTQGVLGMWKTNLGQDTTMLDSLQTNKQTNKGNLLERRPMSIHAIRTLPLATLWTKINPPFLVRKIHPNLSLWSGSTWRQHFWQPAANLCKHLSRALTCLHHGPF